MPENEKLITRLITIQVIALPASRPVTCHSRISIAPRIPKIAPDAPTVTPGVCSSAPADPASPETK
jgi:hypothetical protein